ncbi:bcl-2-like protein 1 [Boleophthalmus pectinirostris]|uniref:bcl-2-like protein 1 n=1 Tax=Boleophthalmus pectinirostris TaxID=150288 RepID=UPI000A1C4C16|nr:bcl-2-like protein 1 [Boleophthalmus pectinirostris]XP_055016917.1 bcl-2-like protein 1 [Boleophthalmus pectinirostris]
MSPSNRELVEFFISYKLLQKNYPSSLLLPNPARVQSDSDKAANVPNGLLANPNGNRQTLASLPPDDHLEAIKTALKDSADEFEELFTQAFSNLSSQLDITPETAYNSFKSVMDEVFKDGVNWGRIVGLFVFGGVLSVECVEKDMSNLVPRIADWMTIYLDENITAWIQSQGGWHSFAQIFGQNAAAEARRSRETLKKWLLVGVGLLTGVLVAMFIAKKQ